MFLWLFYDNSEQRPLCWLIFSCCLHQWLLYGCFILTTPLKGTTLKKTSWTHKEAPPLQLSYYFSFFILCFLLWSLCEGGSIYCIVSVACFGFPKWQRFSMAWALAKKTGVIVFSYDRKGHLISLQFWRNVFASLMKQVVPAVCLLYMYVRLNCVRPPRLRFLCLQLLFHFCSQGKGHLNLWFDQGYLNVCLVWPVTLLYHLCQIIYFNLLSSLIYIWHYFVPCLQMHSTNKLLLVKKCLFVHILKFTVVHKRYVTRALQWKTL